MYRYEHKTTLEELNELLNKNITAIVIFRLKDDYISELAIKKLLTKPSGIPINVIDFQLEKRIQSLSDYNFEYLPKAYYIKNQNIVFTKPGAFSNMMLDRYSQLFFI